MRTTRAILITQTELNLSDVIALDRVPQSTPNH